MNAEAPLRGFRHSRRSIAIALRWALLAVIVLLAGLELAVMRGATP
jgi:hypothetical protein